MKRRMLQLAALSMGSMLILASGTSFAESVQETELDISFEELAAAAAQGYDGEDIQQDVYTEQDPSFVKDAEVVETEIVPETENTKEEEPVEEIEDETEENGGEENASEEATEKEDTIDERDIFERSQFTVGFSKTEDVVSIRNEGSLEADLAGILKPHGMVEIYSETEDGWYEVQAGDIYGYVDKSLIVTDQEARDIAEAVVYQAATPTVKKVKVRTEANAKAKALLTLKKGEEIEVIDAYSDWITVITQKGEVGYVPEKKVAIVKHYPTGMTLDEYEVWFEENAPETESETEAREEEDDQEEYYEPEQTTYTYTDTSTTYTNTNTTYTNTNTTYTQTDTTQTTTPATEAATTQTEATPATEAATTQTEATPATEASTSAAETPAADETGDDTAAEDTSSDSSSEETFAEDEGSDEGDDVVYVDDSDSEGGDEEVYDDTAAVDSTYEDGEVYEE